MDRGLEYFNLNARSLGELRKNDARKLAIARLVRRGAAVSNGWIARELALGHSSTVSRALKLNGETIELEKKFSLLHCP